MTTSFQRVAHKHCRDGEEAEGRKRIHAPSLPGRRAHARRQGEPPTTALGDDPRNSASGRADPRPHRHPQQLDPKLTDAARLDRLGAVALQKWPHLGSERGILLAMRGPKPALSTGAVSFQCRRSASQNERIHCAGVFYLAGSLTFLSARRRRFPPAAKRRIRGFAGCRWRFRP
jgi:hypothetical protein